MSSRIINNDSRCDNENLTKLAIFSIIYHASLVTCEMPVVTEILTEYSSHKPSYGDIEVELILDTEDE